MGTKTDLRTAVLATSAPSAASTWSAPYGGGLATSPAGGSGGAGTCVLTFATPRPRVQDRTHEMAINAVNVWPSSPSGPWSG